MSGTAQAGTVRGIAVKSGDAVAVGREDGRIRHSDLDAFLSYSAGQGYRPAHPIITLLTRPR